MEKEERMAQKLYELLKEDSKGCFDVDVDLKDDTTVSYEDQGGKVEIDFENLTIKSTICLDDYGEISEDEFKEEYSDENTIDIDCYPGTFDLTYGEVTNQYNSLADLRSAMEDNSVFMYLDLDTVFNA